MNIVYPCGLLLLACSSTLACSGTATRSPTSSVESDCEAEEEMLPIAQYLNGDVATGERLRALLEEEGIDIIEYGSLGLTVAASSCDAERARSLVQNAIDANGLNATVIHSESP